MPSPTILTGAGNVTKGMVTSLLSGDSLVADKPANLANNEILLAALSARNVPNTWDVVPSGFVQLNNTDGSGLLTLFAKKIRNASLEPSTYSWSTSASAGRTGYILARLTGSNVGNVFDVAGAAQLNSLSAPGLTPGGTERVLVGLWAAYGSTLPVLSPPAGMTLVDSIAIGSGSSWTTLMMCQEALSSASATGNRLATSSPAESSRAAFLTTLRPSITAGVSLGVSARVGTGFDARRRLAANLPMGAEVGLIAEGDVMMGSPEGELALSVRSGMLLTAKAIRRGAVTLKSSADLGSNPAYGEYNVMNLDGVWQTVPLRRNEDGSWA